MMTAQATQHTKFHCAKLTQSLMVLHHEKTEVHQATALFLLLRNIIVLSLSGHCPVLCSEVTYVLYIVYNITVFWP